MKCEYNYCIYNKDYSCILEEIQINSAGQCDECILVYLPPETLEDYKRNRLWELIEYC